MVIGTRVAYVDVIDREARLVERTTDSINRADPCTVQNESAPLFRMHE